MGEPAWSIATLFPKQGEWTEEGFLAFSVERPAVELSQGRIEVLPMPTDRHQRVLDALFVIMLAFARKIGARVRTAGIRVRRVRDLVTKRREYAAAGIAEYWIVQPEEETVTVLHLEDERYVELGVFARGSRAASRRVPDLSVDVFDAD